MNIPKQLQNKDFKFIKIKNGKIPLEKNWQVNNNYDYNDASFIEYLKKAKGYGILCGCGKLAVIDADEEIIEKTVTAKLPKTFVVETGGGGYHYYYKINDLDNKIVLKDNNKKHMGEVQFTGSQVIGAGSLHPNGKTYNVKINHPIVEISKKELEQALADFIPDKNVKWHDDAGTPIINVAKTIKNLKNIGNELQGPHPIHGSEGGMNFAVNPEKNLWHCFRCGTGGDALSLIAVMEGIIDCDEANKPLKGAKFNKTIKVAKEKYNIEKKERDKRGYLDLSNPPKNLNELYKRLEKWLYITDTYRIDLTLAVTLSNQAKNTKPLWVFIVGASGDAKSETLCALKDYPNALFVDQITANTLATGKTHKGKKVPDMGEELQQSSHLLLFSDLATLKSLNRDEKNIIWGQFRELYDGKINKRTGNDTIAIYEGCHVTMIACTTPDIKAEYSIHNQLGTREFAYEIESNPDDNKNKMKKALEHIEQEDIMKKELQETIQSFLSTKTFNKDIIVEPELRQWLMQKAEELSLFRASVSFETRTGELRGDVSKEVPTRLIQQFELLYKSIYSLDKNYPEERFKHIINNIVKSTGEPIRQQIYEILKTYPDAEYTIQMLHEQMHMGQKTIKRQCEALTAMGIVFRRIATETFGSNNNLERNVRYYSWINKSNKLNKSLY